jgi:DNA-binding winged helix-turn-helix (wHTH) protein/TolB-like protein/Flp pilus assembly protein TadD
MNGQTKNFYAFGPFRFDPEEHTLLRDCKPVPLPPRATETLSLLLQNAGHLVDKDKLMKEVWKDAFVEEGNVNKNIFILRKTLGQWDGGREYIETIPKRGYRFVVSVSRTAKVTMGFHPHTPPGAEEDAPARWMYSLRTKIGISILLLLAFSVLTTWRIRFSRRGTIDSVAVVPFVNLTADQSKDYLSDGITESLIDNLSQIPDLTVRPLSSVSRYKRRDVDPEVMARELNVQAIITGRVTQHGDSLVVSTDLIDARSNRNLWGENYNGKLFDVLAIQREIALGISTRLREKLTREQEAQVSKTATADPEAYQSYLKGRYYWEKRTADALQQARDHFNQAIARDPAFAEAYVGLADYWTIAPDFLAVPLSEALPNEKEAALKALAINSNYAPAHLALANAFFDNWEWANAEREFQLALELDPKFANAHHWYGLGLSFIGRHQEALAHLQRAVELDPLNLKYNANLGQGYINARQYDRALDQLDKTLQMDPKFFMTYEYLAQLYRATGNYDLWLQSWGKKAALNTNVYRLSSVEQLSRAYAAGGYPAAVRRIIQVEKQELPWRYIDPAELGYEYAALGNKDEAFRWLEKACQERSRSLQTILIEPSIDALRSDPRYASLLRRMGLGT